MSTKILPAERKFVKMVQLMDKIVSNDLEVTIDEMINKDPRMLCRLNLKNPQVAQILNKKIAQGEVHPFDLMHDPEETLSLEGLSRTARENLNKLTPEDAEWLENLTDTFKKKTREQALEAKRKRLDESRDNLPALV
jgi:antitoxin component of RelBE/YafQ-DinJ toxin-antitoxin module